MNQAQLDRALDKVKSKVFLNNNAAILGCIMCSLDFRWDTSAPTAYVAGNKMGWNPVWFASLPEETRCTVFLHELWHVARLHSLRVGSRVHSVWCMACDYVINLGLKNDGYSFAGTEPLLNEDYANMSEEQVYDILIKTMDGQKASSWTKDGQEDYDLQPANSQEQRETVNIVSKAVQTAKMLKQCGNTTSDLEELVKDFLKPTIPWQTLLYRFFEDRRSEEHTWARPNRRYQDMYLPSRVGEESFLKTLNYYFDVSGSVSRNEIVRFNSEVKFIKETFNPDRLVIIQFSTRITSEIEVDKDESFDALRVIGRGGTRLDPVKDHILKTKPTAAIIFSDLCCIPMDTTDLATPIIWCVSNNPDANPSYGTVIHIKD